jgi:hypothetical protein
MILTSAQWAVLRSEDSGFGEALLAILNGDVDAPSALTELQRQVDAR